MCGQSHQRHVCAQGRSALRHIGPNAVQPAGLGKVWHQLSSIGTMRQTAYVSKTLSSNASNAADSLWARRVDMQNQNESVLGENTRLKHEAGHWTSQAMHHIRKLGCENLKTCSTGTPHCIPSAFCKGSENLRYLVTRNSKQKICGMTSEQSRQTIAAEGCCHIMQRSTALWNGFKSSQLGLLAYQPKAPTGTTNCILSDQQVCAPYSTACSQQRQGFLSEFPQG